MSKQNIILITLFFIICGTIAAADLNLWLPIVMIATGVIWLGWRQKWIGAVVVAWAEYRATKIGQKRQAEIGRRKAVEEEQRRQAELGKLFKFKTVTVNARGKIIKRTNKQARYQTEDLGNGVTLEMVYILGDTFMMGSPEDIYLGSNEKPQHEVTVEPFFLGKYPVTQAQWEAVMGNNPSRFKGKNRPVETISWYDTVEFIQRLSKMTSKPYSLPSEAQWEYAARAGTTTPFYFGETITSNLANYNGNSTYASEPKGVSRVETTDVGSFPPNAFGLYDMHGNVWEWLADLWHDNYDDAPSDGRVWEEKGEHSYRVLRGGSWVLNPKFCRCANRNKGTMVCQNNLRGFRVATIKY
jgi:formylglycine-generating enzyme required for sulfatase activity